MVKITEILSMYESANVSTFLKDNFGMTLDETDLKSFSINKNWRYVGDNPSNPSSINILRNGEKGIIERITNGIDAVVEKQKHILNIGTALNSDVIVKKAFPVFYGAKENLRNSGSEKINAFDAHDLLGVVVYDGNISSRPTIDVFDTGTGIEGEMFGKTILSLSGSNKISSDKQYLIGAFGQGGSTSLAFTKATIILSKINGHYYFTIVKCVKLNDRKTSPYVYLVDEDGYIMQAENDYDGDEKYIRNFINGDSGTIVRMIEIDIDKKYRSNDVAKPLSLLSYIDSQIFDSSLPVFVLDKRKNYIGNESHQGRYAYGSRNRLMNSEFVNKQYSGYLDVYYKNNTYKIEYYVIFPKDESKWANDEECKKTFETFNIDDDSIIYTVNGQQICSEGYTKISNNGLSFLKYRLLVVINLDVLGSEKYHLFTTNRSEIVSNDDAKDLLDEVILSLSKNEKLKEINNIISLKSISGTIDESIKKEISEEIRNEYNDYLKSGFRIKSFSEGLRYTQLKEEIYYNEIKVLEISVLRNAYYKDEAFSITLKTEANKHINEDAKIYCYIDDKDSSSVFTEKSAMNGRILYIFNASDISIGNHKLQFIYYNKNGCSKESNVFPFEILDEISPETTKKERFKNIDFNMEIVENKSLICEISKDINTKKILALVDIDHEELSKEIYYRIKSADQIAGIKKTIIEPIILYALFLADTYTNANDETKNKMIISFVKSFVISNKNKGF